MLGRHLKSRATGATKYDRNFELSARHVEHLGGGIYDLVGCQNRKVEGHEFYNRPQANHGCTNAKTCETKFGNRSVDDALVPKLVEQSFRYLVCTLICRNLFAHQKDVRVALQLFANCLIERFANCHYG